MPYACGNNIAGYLPESVHYVRDFKDAKALIIQDLLFAADYAADEETAEEYSAAAEDANLWGSLDDSWLLYVSTDVRTDEAWWIVTISDDEYEQNTGDDQ